MKLETSVLGDTPVVKILGDVDHFSRPSLADAVKRALDGGGTHIAFDLSDCPYMDSAGIGILLGLLQRMTKDGLLTIIAADGHLLHIFEMVGLTLSANARFLSSLKEFGDLSAEGEAGA